MRQDILVLFLISGGSIQSFTMKCNRSCTGFLQISFVRLEKEVPFNPSLFSIFIMKGCWILSNAFSGSIEIVLFLLSLLIWYFTFIYFQIRNQPYNLGINLTWSWCIPPFKCCWIWFASTFWGFLYLYS